MFRQCLLLLSLSVFFCAKASAQLRENEGAQKRQPESIKEFRVRHRKQGNAVMFWNVENLFDCKDDTLKEDADFQPKGSYNWTPSRYWKKLDNLSRVFAAVTDECAGWPMLVGLAEVENDSVLRDLTRRSPLSIAGFRYVLTEGPDARGIDVGLLYQPSRFELLSWRAVRVPSEEHGYRPTRDILYVCGRVGVDTLHVLVVHLPSKSRGGQASKKHRRLAVECVRSMVDSLAQKKVLVMGDFNAEPDEDIFETLCPPLQSLMPKERRHLRGRNGTYVFQGQWGYLDHMLVSESLLPFIEDGRARVVKFPFMLNDKGHPWRTYRGPVYEGGYSDHLPLLLQMKKFE